MKGTMDTDDFISLAHLEATSMNMRFAYGKVNDAVESGKSIVTPSSLVSKP